MKGKILVVDDDAALGKMCEEAFTKRGYEAKAVTSAAEALEALQGPDEYRVVLTDLVMPTMGGIDLMKRAQEINEPLDFIVMTSYGTIDNAVEAMKLGAADYITKPFKLDVLVMAVDRLLEVQDLESEVVRLRSELEGRFRFENIIGQSPKMQQVYDLIESVSETDANVLIQGETGTGKELVARAIHYNSHRKDKPFVKVDCAALTETLLESELFGHVKGSFTGAIRDRDGRFRTADKGTIFLDEIGNVPITIQTKLLRVVQDSQFEPVGGDETIAVDVRVIAATNADLGMHVKQDKFRSDLFYRLNVITIQLPPLREKKEDIPALVAKFLVQYREKNNRPITSISRPALHKLMSYDWPGNVRELENMIERAVILCKGDTIEPQDLSLPHDVDLPDMREKTLDDAIDEVEKRIILDTLQTHDGNKIKAAKALGISRASLYNKLKKHDIGK
ncbi:MAG: sigma-54-dependent Fis family transcriptional regulator [Planctomycetes bacterium]|nr:sigma-54-dependent Fis family transcriptional regulator [Planctomycetota bacterium]